eukprot:1145955-Pelagomonas_calceolata.AAC.1
MAHASIITQTCLPVVHCKHRAAQSANSAGNGMHTYLVRLALSCHGAAAAACAHAYGELPVQSAQDAAEARAVAAAAAAVGRGAGGPERRQEGCGEQRGWGWRS